MAEGVVSFGIEKLWDLLSRESERLSGIHEQVAGLKRQLRRLQSLLEDANGKKHESKRVRNFLEDVQDIVYDAEDIIESFILKESRGEEKGIKKHVKRFACFVVERRNFATDIEDITKRISEVIEEMQSFGIQQIIDGGPSLSLQDRQREQREIRETFSNVSETDLVGVEKSVEELVCRLVENDNSFQVVSITGMGGIGKTTLARQVFHHGSVQSHFNGFAWVCVSQDFTRKHIWQTILQGLRPHDHKDILKMNEHTLQDKLFQLLETSKYLIVLDDVWKDKDWDRIKAVFPPKGGWKILLTSRNESVGFHADTRCFPFRPKILTHEESWNLCQMIVFPKRDETDDDENIEMINELDDEEQAIHLAIANNKSIIQYLLHQQNNNVIHGGSVRGRSFIHRDRESAHHRLFNDYFSETPTYNDVMFRRRYRMSRSLFLRIIGAVENHDSYFKQRRDVTGRLGLSSLQKGTTVFRMLAYGLPADATDEYVKIGESTAIESMNRFCRAIVDIFSERYLRSPTPTDVARLLYIGEKRGFPGMLGSLDCMHWKWKNCPTAWAGQYAGRSGSPTIILEAVADYDLWIWHAYFGMPGSNNDINVLESSHLFSNLAQGIAPPARYVIQGKEYNIGYYLADGIYPKWSTIVQTIHKPMDNRKKYFATQHEACRKDVERAFGVLQSRFAIVKGPARFWKKNVIHDIMSTCIILHNMIIKDERDLGAPIEVGREAPPSEVEIAKDENTRFQEFLARYKQIKNKEAHFSLRNALIDHLWEK